MEAINESINDSITKQKLVDDCKVVLKDVEILLRETTDTLNERAVAARARLESGMQKMRARLVELEDDIRNQANIAARATDDYVREHPWQSAGVALGVGFVIGAILSRSSR